jgi:hypothetical protein
MVARADPTHSSEAGLLPGSAHRAARTPNPLGVGEGAYHQGLCRKYREYRKVGKMLSVHA